MVDPGREAPARLVVGEHLAQEIRRLRHDAGLSQPELAARIGYTPQYVSIAERPRKGLPSAHLVAALDTALAAHGALIDLRERAVQERHARRESPAGDESDPGVMTPPVPAAPLDAHTTAGVSGQSPMPPVDPHSAAAAAREPVAFVCWASQDKPAPAIVEYVAYELARVGCDRCQRTGPDPRGEPPTEFYSSILEDIQVVPTSELESDSVNRKNFIASTLGAGLSVFVGTRTTSSDAGQPDLVSAGDVSGPIVHYRRIEQDVPARTLLPAVNAQLELARQIVQRDRSPKNGLAALAEGAGLAAWLAMDSGDNSAARARYLEAIRYSEVAGHPLLASYMVGSLAQFAIESGAITQGINFLDRANRLLGASAPPSAHAWMQSLYAVSYARLDDADNARRALAKAEKLASTENVSPVWPWVFPFTEAKATRYQSIALARLGDVKSARAAYDAAAPSMTAPKPRALVLLEQGRMFVQAGQIDEGCGPILEALEIGKSFDSERVIAGVLSLRSNFPMRSRETTRLDNALVELYHTKG